jgi:hypothetical protein
LVRLSSANLGARAGIRLFRSPVELVPDAAIGKLLVLVSLKIDTEGVFADGPILGPETMGDERSSEYGDGGKQKGKVYGHPASYQDSGELSS